MRVAIVHDWLVAPGGAEDVIEQIIECFPDTGLFNLVDFPEDRRPLRGKPVTLSFIQRMPFARRHYRAYLPLMPLAIEQFDLTGCDPIITSSHAVANGALVGPDQTHVSHGHSRMRYACDLQHQYLREARLTRGPRSPAACRASAERFSAAVFRRAFIAEVTRTIAAAVLRSESGGGAGRRRSHDRRVERPAKPASQSSWGR